MAIYYNVLMFVTILRRIGLTLTIIVFSLAFQLAIIFIPMTIVLQNRQNISSWLADSGAYDKFGPVVASQLASPDRPNADVGIQPAELEAVVKESLPTDVLATQVSSIVSGFYDWLEGKTAQPQFAVNLADRQPQIEAAFSRLIESKLTGAPRCSPAQLDGYDPFSDICLPRGQTAAETARTFASQLFAADGPFANLKLDSNELFKNQNFSDHPLPKIYSKLGLMRIILAAVTVVSGGLAILLSASKLAGLKRLSWIVFTTTLFASVGALITTKLVPGMLNRSTLDTAETEVNISGLIIPIVTEAATDIGQAILFTTIPLMVVSIIVLIVIWRKNKKPPISMDKIGT